MFWKSLSRLCSLLKWSPTQHNPGFQDNKGSALSFPPQVTIWVMIIFYSNVNNENTDNAVKHELYMSWKSNGIHFPSFYVNTLIQHDHGTTVEAPP